MPRKNIPLLGTTDWNEEWRLQRPLRREAEKAGYWDARAEGFSRPGADDAYTGSFLALAGIGAHESVFDMGCGTGDLSVPLGRTGRKVVACDFSQGMLDRLGERLWEEGIETVTPHLVDWNEDWIARGMRPEMVDVAIASRSLGFSDLGSALERLDAMARRRVCVTLPCGSSPRMDSSILRACGVEMVFDNDFQYAFNILANRGIRPSVDYIESTRLDEFDSFDEAFAFFGDMIEAGAIDRTQRAMETAKTHLEAWLLENLVENPPKDEGAGSAARRMKRFSLHEPRTIRWAFVAWDK